MNAIDKIAADWQRRCVQPRGGGRATDPEWTERRLVRMSPATLTRLERLARLVSDRGVALGSMQLAAMLIEQAMLVTCSEK